MTATPQDVQAKIAAALDEIKRATTAPATMVAGHGQNPSGWPSGHLRTGFLGVQAASVEVGQLVAPSAPTPPSPPPSSDPVAQPEPPAFTPTRTLPTATTWAELQTAIQSLQPGDHVTAKGVVLPSEAVFDRQLAAPAEVVFDSACKATGGKGTYYPAVFFRNVSWLRFISQGMAVTNPSDGHGVELGGASHCVFDGFDVHDCATDALRIRPYVAAVAGNYIRATVRDWARVPSLDDHAEDGTGLHGLNAENSRVPYRIDNNTIVLTTPGSKMGGSLLEIGTAQQALAPSGNRVWLQAAGLLQDAKSQTAANALNLWGYLASLEAIWIGASGLHGFAVHSSPYSGGFSGVKIAAGAAASCCLNPPYAGQNPWMKNGGVVYSPGPFAPAP